ncbi:putative BPI/LBP family protein At3g20270 isoform X1 [Phragmites australis]|uniref:putative BPI/LBP family protein At3g20270 isoform X1 n=1 Tax=Phragmites australis TaxID=29695 RepID=UPI002D7805AB|nr:putative BPI/LBP family protein At3g20270 isoform X1 [Phragmites australis]
MVFALRTAQSQRPIVNRPFPNLSEYLIRRRPLTRRGQADGGGTHGRRASGRRRRVVVQQAVAQRRQSAASVGGQRRSSAQQEGRGAGSLRLDQAGLLQHMVDKIPDQFLLNTASWRLLIPQLYHKYPDDDILLNISAISPPFVRITVGLAGAGQ